MKKTVKKTIAILLAVIMACGSLTAFAATPADIKWNFWEDESPLTYSYAGEITVDGDTVDVSATEDNNFVYCTFVAEKDGHYKISSTYNSTDWMGIPAKYENGVYFGFRNGYYGGEYSRELCCYLEAGEYVIGFDFFEQGSEEVSATYMGDVVDIVCDEGTFDNLFLGYNVYDYYDDDYDDNNDAKYTIAANVLVKFENGEDIVIDYTDLLIYTDEELRAGENKVEIGIFTFEYKEAMTLTILDIKELITKIELTDIEKYTALVEYYTGDYYFEEIPDGTLTVTYADGSTETVENFVEYAWLEKYDIEVYTYYDYDENWDFCYNVGIADAIFIVEDCELRAATAFENIGIYNSLNTRKISNTFNWMSIYFRDIFLSESIPEAFGRLGYFFTESAGDWLYTVAYITRNTADIFSYLF